MPASNDFEFARLVYQLLVTERTVELDVVANAIGMKYATLHARLNRRVHFRPAEIRALLGIVQDQRLISYFLQNTRFTFAERPPVDPAPANALEWSHEALFRIVEALQKLTSALEDNVIDHRERLQLLSQIEQAEVAVASLKATVDCGGRHGSTTDRRGQTSA
ncbi:phage regulatory CII family protein [Bradyrhizobium sp. SZCCHNRI20481]|uniref:phage regulatory CII family protein n=1 Tax=Bradyrhizobium sp. SZCCHNRI20481 TaxID=3057286 RepID=UPI00291600E1|nr:phage regulatory CII family protein [Bradyrhizobium sp. SZCCHNRI20481]